MLITQALSLFCRPEKTHETSFNQRIKLFKTHHSLSTDRNQILESKFKQNALLRDKSNSTPKAAMTSFHALKKTIWNLFTSTHSIKDFKTTSEMFLTTHTLFHTSTLTWSSPCCFKTKKTLREISNTPRQHLKETFSQVVWCQKNQRCSHRPVLLPVTSKSQSKQWEHGKDLSNYRRKDVF